MSNPALFVAPLASSLAYTDRSGSGVLTGVDPIRHMGAGGLLLEDAGTNLITSPLSPALFAYGHLTLSSVTGQDIDHPDWPVHSDRYRRATITSGAPGTSQMGFECVIATPAAGTVVQAEVLIRFSASRIGDTQSVILAESGGAQAVQYYGMDSIVATGDWQVATGSFALAQGDRTRVFMYVGAASAADQEVGSTFDVTFGDVRLANYRTSPIPSVNSGGTPIAGYAFTGTAHASTSTRAASSASVPTAGIISPNSGSLAFRFTRKIDTGDIEYILNCGTDGDDRLRIYIDTDDRLRVAWDTGGALPQSVVSSSTIAVGTEYLVYTEWDGINIAMSLDAGTLVTGIRDVPLGSWGTDDLVLGP